MTARRLWTTINEMSEQELRLQVVIPVLAATPDVTNVTDVHGQNERGLDVIFFTENDIERICYGLQLKRGNISGGGTAGAKTVKQIVDQLELAEDFDHPVATKNAGVFRIDRFIVATSGKISDTARDEIARRHTHVPVKFWDGDEIIRRIHKHLPQLFEISDGASAGYLRTILERFDALDALDQIPGVAKRTLTQVFEEPSLRRAFDPTIGQPDGSAGSAPRPALSLLATEANAVIVADQDAGKTSILRMMALKRARDILAGNAAGMCLPVIVRAKDVLHCGLTVGDAIGAEFRRLGAPELAATAEADLAAGHYYVAVDGFSEVLRDEDKQRVADLVAAFAEQYPAVRVVVAGRPVDFLKPRFFTDFHRYQIDDFNDAQSASLIRRWTGDSPRFADVAQKMVARLREALQLPGSPIPATIGVMLHEEQGRFITNTAEAIDRYMVIRLGRYAHELGMKQEVDWARKQDLLSEVAFEMVADGRDTIRAGDLVARINQIQERQGDMPNGAVIVDELVHSGVLHPEGHTFSFFRSSFRDFFAAHHVYQRGDLDAFAVDNLLDRRWGGVSVFAAGLRRSDSRLLNGLAAAVGRLKSGAADGVLGDDYFYAAYLCGRVLANSESADHAPKVAALRTTLDAIKDSVPEIEALAVEQYGNIGHLMALMTAEQSFFVTVGVPWLRNQLRHLLSAGEPDAELDDDARYLLASTYTHLGYDDCFAVLEAVITEATSTRVLVVLQVLLWQLEQARRVQGKELAALENLKRLVGRRLAKRGDEVRALWDMKSHALKIERDRLRRLYNREKRLGKG